MTTYSAEPNKAYNLIESEALGKIESGGSLMNTVKDKRERVGRMLMMHSNDREDIKEAYAGDIIAIAGSCFDAIKYLLWVFFDSH